MKIGTIQGTGDYGKGHKLLRQNNGDPEKTKTWREVQQEPEPDVGSSFEEYWVGAESCLSGNQVMDKLEVPLYMSPKDLL